MFITNNKKRSKPILTSILDTDAYKLHMQQAVFHHYPDANVVAEFRCRSDDKLGKYATLIQDQIDLMHALALTEAEYNYLASFPFFKGDYLNWFKNFRYNPALITLQNKQDELILRIEGRWLDVILWEVPLLAVISEIVHQNRTPEMGENEAIAVLKNKLRLFKEHSADLDISRFNLMDFGTRRRYSVAVHTAVVKYLKDHFPGFNNTSNYHLARQLDLTPSGTQAHEWFQAHQQLSKNLANFQRNALTVWLTEYPNHLSVALTDCIAMDAFLLDFDKNLAMRYTGLRHDSGDPITWGEKAIAHYLKLGIDTKTKTLIFSDSLNFTNALKIYRHFYGRIKLAFGIGSYLTCDLPNAPKQNTKTLNIVVKLVECDGRPVAKLSDSPGKTISEDPKFIDRLKKTFNISDH